MIRKLSVAALSAAVALSLSDGAAQAGQVLPNIQKMKRPPASKRLEAMRLKRRIAFKIDKSMQSKLTSLQWKIVAGSEGRPILSGNHYRLVNLVLERGLKRQKRTAGANLGWLEKNSNSFNVLIKRQKGNGELRYGDVVALNLKPYGWLRYKKRKYGINLGDDDHKPHYIWVVKGGLKGAKVVSGAPVALYNTGARTEVTYCKRTWGINLGHRGKSKCGGIGATISSTLFGENGLLNTGDGLSGDAYKLAKGRLCEMGVGALAAGATAITGGSGAPLVGAAAAYAITECKEY